MEARLIVSAFAFGVALVLSQPACSSTTTSTPGGDGGTTGATTSAVGVGDPCTPAQERDPTFLGFDEKEVNLETKSPACATGVCLVNHFRGRVSCPYGQAADGTAASGAMPCTTPDTHAAVDKKQVAAQCIDRTATKTVYCSCRCANVNGRKDDGGSYCACGDGFTCTPLVTAIGAGNDDITGSYCIKMNTAYDAATACNQGDCDPAMRKCD